MGGRRKGRRGEKGRKERKKVLSLLALNKISMGQASPPPAPYLYSNKLNKTLLEVEAMIFFEQEGT